jgi:cAMP phosphodiesterase
LFDVRVLGSFGSRVPGHQTTCLLVNGHLALDAGGLTGVLSVEEQLAIDHVLISHAHLDHVYDLAFLLDNVIARRQSPLKVWAPQEVLTVLKTHLFNDQIWPDLTRVQLKEFPALELCPLTPGTVTQIDGLNVEWAPTDHTVFSAGYVLSDGDAAMLFTGDTTTTMPIWSLGNNQDGLCAVFVEVSFPDRMADLAKETGHLTPALLRDELAKLDDSEIPVKIFHMKPQYLDEICRELEPLSGRCEILNGSEQFLLSNAKHSDREV